MSKRVPKAVPSTWPVFVALGLIALLILVMLGADLLVARRVAARTTEIVGNSQRSIELVDDLRAQTHRLSRPEVSFADTNATLTRITADVKAYDPLATSAGEKEEWSHLRELLAHVQSSPTVWSSDSILAAAIARSLDRLVGINGRASHEQVVAIHGIHERAILVDTLVGGLAFALAALIAAVLLRLLRRQQQLVTEHVTLVEERNRELDAFAGRAAHDLRVPLNPIRGYADLLALDHNLPESVREMAARIRQAVTKMSRVIDDMLELSRAGRPTPGLASPANVVTRVLDEMKAELQGARIVTQIGDDSIACGPSVLEQVVRNLLGNAAKFRARSRPLLVTIRTVREGAQIALSVEDNGMGLDPDAAKHAFEPYFRSYSAREVPGHGLGLAIVERVVQALGGTCEIAAAPEQGTRVTVRLPGAMLLETHASGETILPATVPSKREAG
jgi:signal transduction histidine kinase